MKIAFIGQKTIPAFSQGQDTSREQRVEALGQQLSAEGHTVGIYCLSPGFTPSLTRYTNIQVWHGAGPRWLYSLLSFYRAWRWKAEVIHIHGWQTAAFLPIIRILQPRASLIWTIDMFPTKYHSVAKIIITLAQAVTEAITVPHRALQYRILYTFGLRATYVADGYTPSLTPDIPVKQFGLRKNQYCLAFAYSPEEIRWVATSFSKLKTRKKLVVLGKNKPWIKRRYGAAVVALEGLKGRPLLSLINNAAMIIFSSENTSSHFVLNAMEASKPIVAITKSLYEEILGVTAQFVRFNDKKALVEALQPIMTNKKMQMVWGQKASKRARLFFDWDRLTNEYMAAYRKASIKQIPLDSIVPRLASQISK